MKKGRCAVIPWPDITIGSETETVQLQERFGQGVINAWGAARRAFLSSCIEDRKWMEDEAEGDTFHGDIQQSDRRLV